MNRFERRRQQKLGATGRYPRGKINKHDEGELNIAVAADPEFGNVVVRFGKPIAWFAMPKAAALDFAAMLVRKANDLSDEVAPAAEAEKPENKPDEPS